MSYSILDSNSFPIICSSRNKKIFSSLKEFTQYITIQVQKCKELISFKQFENDFKKEFICFKFDMNKKTYQSPKDLIVFDNEWLMEMFLIKQKCSISYFKQSANNRIKQLNYELQENNRFLEKLLKFESDKEFSTSLEYKY